MTFDEMIASIPEPASRPDLSGTYTKPSGLVLTVSTTEVGPGAMPVYRVQGRAGGRLVRAGLYRQDALAPMLRDAVRAED